MKKVLAAAVMLACFVVGIITADIMNLDFFSKEKVKYDIKLIGKQVTEISEIATVEYRYKGDAIYDGGARKLFGKDIPLTSKSMLVYYEGIVKMGSDLSAIHVDLNEHSGKLAVTIPHSKILSHELDEDTWEVLDVDNGLFNRVTPQDNGEFVKEQKHRMEQEISKSDLSKQADEKTVKQLKSFLKMTYPELEIQVLFVK